MRNEVVFFDLETGGLDPATHPMIQFAGVAVNRRTWEVTGELELKIQFEVARCSPQALEVNSFNAELWEKEAVPLHRALDLIVAFLRPHATETRISKKGKPYSVARLAGHNAAAFDAPFFFGAFRSLNRFCPAEFRVLDTLQLALWAQYRGELEGIEDLKLQTLGKHFGLEVEGEAHDALADVRLNAAVAYKLLERRAE